jgi:hypothetical protein
MKSHTVSHKLLEQFAYYDRITKCFRLWRYEKSRTPYPKASPRTATRIDGHFAHPEDAAKEEELETRLAAEFEECVNQFLSRLDDPSFVPTDLQRRQLTFYVTLLFNRSEARRAASKHLHDVTIHAVEKFISNEVQVLTVAAKWSIDLLLGGKVRNALVTKQHVVHAAMGLLENYQTERKRQQSYVEMIERAMLKLDEALFDGRWDCRRTSPDNPFVISDAPVVTWERLGTGLFSYGLGFHRPNVEIFLPLSPMTCLHILPNVKRTRSVLQPTVQEINIAQAAFASHYCFTNINSAEINSALQPNFGRAKLGVTAFTIWHRNYDNPVYELLMNDGKWVEPPLK